MSVAAFGFGPIELIILITLLAGIFLSVRMATRRRSQGDPEDLGDY